MQGAASQAAGMGVMRVGEANPPQTILLIGDSVTAQNGAGPSPLDPASDSQGARGYWVWANLYLGQRFRLVAQKGVGGDTTTGMLARFNADVLGTPSGWVCIEGGTNDLAGGTATATIIANLSAMVSRALSAGRKVLLLTVLPSTSYDTAGKRTALSAVNEWIKTQASGRVIVADAWATYQDPGNNGFPKAGYTVDGVHPSSFGAERIGRCIADALLPATFAWNLAGMWGRAVTPALLTNIGFSAATNWTANGVPNISLAASAGKMTMTLAAYTNLESVILTSDLIGSGRWAAGDIVQACAHVKWSNVVPHVHATQMAYWPVVKLLQRNVDNSFTTNAVYGISTGSGFMVPIDPALLPTSGEGTVITPRATVGPNVNRLYFDLGWMGADSGTFEFSNAYIWKE